MRSSPAVQSTKSSPAIVDGQNESIGLVACHALSAGAGRYDSWIVDSGATCHMCNDKRLFVELHNLDKPQEVALRDGHDVEAIGRGVVVLETKLPSGRTRKCKLHEMLYMCLSCHTTYSACQRHPMLASQQDLAMSVVKSYMTAREVSCY